MIGRAAGKPTSFYKPCSKNKSPAIKSKMLRAQSDHFSSQV